jgi:lycopene cyclase domain-containing protein
VSYTVLALISVAVVIFIESGILKTGLFQRTSFYIAYSIVIFFQLITNGYLTGTEIVTYGEDAIMGIRIVNAPLEDLLFGFSLVVLTMAVWLKLDGLGEKRGIKQNAKQMENS